jgi:heterodisulfide reductase subunit C
MYLEGYGKKELAKVTYGGIPAGRTAAQCLNCSGCVARCANGLNIAEKMLRARIYLA